jgi:DNA-binding PadR family transcriptional regulator
VESPIARMRKKTTAEMLWPYFLKLLSERPMCGYELMKKVERRFGWRPPVVTSYMVLQSLRRDGYVAAERSGGTRQKTLYRITPRGRRLLREGQRYIRKLCRVLSG